MDWKTIKWMLYNDRALSLTRKSYASKAVGLSCQLASAQAIVDQSLSFRLQNVVYLENFCAKSDSEMYEAWFSVLQIVAMGSCPQALVA
jgi:hypothetical protein